MGQGRDHRVKFITEESENNMRRQPSMALYVAQLLILFALIVGTQGATYVVGPGKTYANPGAVPWESLNAGDVVEIHYSSTPYKNKWVICRQGTASNPITIRGVPNSSGQLPIIDGEGATTRSQLSFTGAARAVIKIGSARTPSDTMPSYIVLENLDVRGAKPPNTYTDSGASQSQPYATNAAAIWIEKGNNIIIRNCIIRDSANGLFVSIWSESTPTRDILIEGNYIYNNGMSGRATEHNTYCAAVNITYQYNRYGPLCSGCNGNALKDRSLGMVARYNWIEAGNRQLDLVEQDDTNIVQLPLYRRTYAYGNVLIEPDGAGNRQFIHYGGDNGNEALYRKGVLYLYHNTFISTRVGRTSVIRISTNAEAVDARNNIFYISDTNDRQLELIADGAGYLYLRNNWFRTNSYVESFASVTGAVVNTGILSSSTPGFVNVNSQNFRLAAGSVCINGATALNSTVLPEHNVLFQYLEHQKGEARASIVDVGAFGYSSAPVSTSSSTTARITTSTTSTTTTTTSTSTTTRATTTSTTTSTTTRTTSTTGPASTTTTTTTRGTTTTSSTSTTSGSDCVTTIDGFQSFQLPGTQTGSFNTYAYITPTVSTVDGVFMLSNGPITQFAQGSVCVLFKDGTVQAYDATGYRADNNFSWTSGTRYAVHISVNVAAQTFDVNVGSDFGSMTRVATGFRFRAAANSLNTWSTRHSDFEGYLGTFITMQYGSLPSGPMVVCDVSLTLPSTSTSSTSGSTTRASTSTSTTRASTSTSSTSSTSSSAASTTSSSTSRASTTSTSSTQVSTTGLPCTTNLNVFATVTASVPGAPGSFNVNSFVTRLLNIPPDAIAEVEVMLDQSTSQRTAIRFKLVSVNCVDPVAKAIELKNLAETRDPKLDQFGLGGLEITTVGEQDQISASSIRSFSALLMLGAAVHIFHN